MSTAPPPPCTTPSNRVCPYLEQFHFCEDGGSCSASDQLTRAYTTTAYNDGTFYGFLFSYQFSEQIHELLDPTGAATAYATPSGSYYLDGAGSDLLGYTATTSSATLPNTSGSDYTSFVVDGSLVGFANSTSPNTNLYHYTYLTDATDDFQFGASAHSYELVYDNNYIGASIQLPAIFGGYGTGSNNYSATNNQNGVLLLDEHGNPARLPSSWLSTGSNPDDREIVIEYDAFDLYDQSLSITDSTLAATPSDGTYVSTVNYFAFLDQAHALAAGDNSNAIPQLRFPLHLHQPRPTQLSRHRRLRHPIRQHHHSLRHRHHLPQLPRRRRRLPRLHLRPLRPSHLHPRRRRHPRRRHRHRPQLPPQR